MSQIEFFGKVKIEKCSYSQASEKLKAINKEGAIYFVGAGISMASGLPLQNNIKRLIIQILCQNDGYLLKMYKKNHQNWNQQLDQIMMEEVFQLIHRYNSSFLKESAAIFSTGKPTNYHYGLATLLATRKIKAVISLNFDTLIEQAYLQLQQSNPNLHLPDLKVIFSQEKIGEVEENRPILFKIHGCVSDLNSMVLTLNRVGKGLEKWKREFLNTFSKTPFVFIGYSDRDKDITPYIIGLKNKWLWFLYNGSPISSHIRKDTIFETMLSDKNRIILYTDPTTSFNKSLADITEISSPRLLKTGESNWSIYLEKAMANIPVVDKLMIMGDMLREQLSLYQDSEKVYSYILRKKNITTTQRVYTLIKRNAIYGEQWKMDKVKKNLTLCEKLSKDIPNNNKLMGALNRQKGNYYQQVARENLKIAIEAFKNAEDNYKRDDDRFNECWSKQNRAVALHKSGELENALPLYEDSINGFRELGEVVFLAQTLVNFGSLKASRQEFEDASAIYKEAMELFHMLGNFHWEARCMVNLSSNYKKLGQNEKAYHLLISAIKTLEEVEDTHWIKVAHESLKSLEELYLEKN